MRAQDRANRESQRRHMLSLAAPYPAFEHFDRRSVTTWGETGRMTKMFARWVKDRETRARAVGHERHPPSRLCVGLERRLDAFLKKQETAIVKRYEELAAGRRALDACYSHHMYDNNARAEIMGDARHLSLAIAEMRYVRDRREITFLAAYARMRAPSFTMHSWMMARRQSHEPVGSDSYEINLCPGEHGGFYRPIAAFIWQ